MEARASGSESSTMGAFPRRSAVTRESVQTDARKRRVGKQRGAWRHALAVAFSGAIIFLLVKCTMHLVSRNGAAIRMLSNGFRGQTVGLLRRQLALSPGDGGDACTPPRAPQQSKRESKSKRPWWQLLKPSNSSSRMTETLEGPSAGEGVAWSGQHKPSSVRRPGERVEHTTNVPIGNEQSVHYQAMDTYYPFPLLGGVEAPENQSLRELLREIQDIATYLCSFHPSMFSKGLEAKYALNNGNSSVVVHVNIVETYLNEPGPLDSRFKVLYPSGRGWEPSHFRRDFACVAEEMLTNVLAEAEDGINRGGRTTQWVFRFQKPAGVASEGRVLLEIYAAPGENTQLAL